MATDVLVVRIAGACRKSELTFLRVEDVTDEETYFRVNIANTKTRVVREFVITPGDIERLNFVDIIRKYRNLFLENIKQNRFFVRYRNGKCGVQPVGINTIGQLPKIIAEGYVENSIENKKIISGDILGEPSNTNNISRNITAISTDKVFFWN